MASYFNRDDQALPGFASFFQKNSDEELGTILQTEVVDSTHFLAGKGRQVSLWTISQFFFGQDVHFSLSTQTSRGSVLHTGTTSLWQSWPKKNCDMVHKETCLPFPC